ncbi:ROK family glucokinase [Staphylospora marina]|uniref:ROK family glucokinase n=1 Tax=Staphylospora marina TaxID=2490858 RepID=UPI000F5B9F81|nr:ROK family glucokinase [Staphylospora marina]
MESRWIGVDLGGTAMKLGLVDREGRVIAEAEHPTLGEEGPDGVLGRMVRHARELAEEAGVPWKAVKGVGVGLPGFLDIPGGVVKHLTNLGWKDVPIRALLEEAWQVPVMIENDANAAALGEAWCGAGRGVDDLVCFTLGTGVGGGIVSSGQLIHGFKGFAGEVGHIRVQDGGVACNCGQTGCLETIASATGMVRLAEEAIREGKETVLAAKKGALSTRDLFEAKEQGDAVAREVIHQAVDALARAMAMLSVVLNPQRFVIGGGVSKAGESLLTPLREAYARHSQAHVREEVEIVGATLGNRAGLVGAAGLHARNAGG